MFIYCTTADTDSEKLGGWGIFTDGAGSFTSTISTFDLPRLFFSICPGYKNTKPQKANRQANMQQILIQNTHANFSNSLGKKGKNLGKSGGSRGENGPGDAKPMQSVIE